MIKVEQVKIIAQDLQEDIGKSGQLMYMDGKASVYGTIKKVNEYSIVFQPGAHLTFEGGIYSINPDYERLRERLNCNEIIKSWLFNVRDFAEFSEGMARDMGYDIREAPNIPKLPNF